MFDSFSFDVSHVEDLERSGYITKWISILKPVTFIYKLNEIHNQVFRGYLCSRSVMISPSFSREQLVISVSRIPLTV